VAGGLDALKTELRGLGSISFDEKKGAIIFCIVLILWMTDRYHMQWFGFEISAVMAALVGAIIALTPQIGVLKWSEAEIPWHLLIFSAGAYAGGLALEGTGAARWLVAILLDAFGIKQGISFWVVYIIIMAVSAYSHVFFTSKTMRTIILIPLIIALAQKLGFDPVALALPAAITMDWVVSLPINSKPNLILYSAGHFSVSDNFLSGMIVTTIGFLLLVVAGFTIYRLLGIVPY
jgi:di/tricarboxylate transporter